MTDNLKYLLGGYATGTLTPEENAALMEAALDDQELFDALADDEALRRYLADPSFRKDLLKATAPHRSNIGWIAGLAVAAASLSVGIFWTMHRDVAPPVTQMAVARPPVVESAPPVAAPAPKNSVAEEARRPPVPRAKKVIEARNLVQPQKTAEAKKEPELMSPPQPSPARGVIGGQPGIEALGAVAGTVAPPPASAPAAPRAGAVAGFAPRSAVRTAGALAKSDVLPKPTVTGKVTDANGAVITVNAGTNAGVKIGDRLDLFHDGALIGYIIINVTDLEYSVGKYTGDNTPAIGDTASTPKK